VNVPCISIGNIIIAVPQAKQSVQISTTTALGRCYKFTHRYNPSCSPRGQCDVFTCDAACANVGFSDISFFHVL